MTAEQEQDIFERRSAAMQIKDDADRKRILKAITAEEDLLLTGDVTPREAHKTR
jgi:hypothetical protein